jgi:Asp-tRNA(Asn)/Glu-tRNA(Gln) amidotransferase B subunit|tara:strand:- start:23276 stop:23830 length:555 start_codon:yes stop_codon:yes gene_type:complete
MSSFEEVAKELSSVDERGLGRVSRLANAQLHLEEQVATIEESLKQAKRELRKIAEDQLPAAMLEYGIREFKLEDGSQITVKNFYGASIPKNKQEEAFAWLIDNDFGDLIKNQVNLSFVRGQEQKAMDLVQELEERFFQPSTRKWVEPMTLKAFAREQVEAGNKLPSDLFGLYIGEQAKITKPKR